MILHLSIIKKAKNNFLTTLAVLSTVTLVGCEGNAFTVNVKDKTIDRELTTFYINGDSTFIRYSLKLDFLGASTKKFYLLGTNPHYDVYIDGGMFPIDGEKYLFSPKINRIYTLENSSNGDASGCEVKIKFDSMYNIHLIDPPPQNFRQQ